MRRQTLPHVANHSDVQCYVCRMRELTRPSSFRKYNLASSETRWNLNLHLIGSKQTSYILPTLRRRLKAGEKVWVHTEPGRTSAKKATDNGALSKHSCRTCVHTCVFVYTHRLSVSAVPTGLRGFVAEALINRQPPLALQRASISQHTLFLKSQSHH